VGTIWNSGAYAHADDDHRAEIVIAFQILMQVCMFSLIAIFNTHVNSLEKETLNAINKAFKVAGDPLSLPGAAAGKNVAEAVKFELLAALVLPAILDGYGETNLTALDDKGSG
jgi:hypothetical protein